MVTIVMKGKFDMNDFAELTRRLAIVNFSDDELVPIEEEFGEEYKELLASFDHKGKRLRQLIQTFPKMDANLLIVFGPGGVGKTFNVERALKDGNMKFETIGSKISPTDLYEKAYEHRAKGEILVFDDCDSVLGGGVINNLMKHLTDSYPIRHMTYSNKSMETPNSFDYEGKIIILTNKDVDPDDLDFQALLTRAQKTELPITNREKVAYSIHMLLTKGKYKTDALYKMRANFCARFLWHNSKYFENKYYSLRAANKFPDTLIAVHDDPKDFVEEIKHQDFFQVPKSK